MRFSNPYRAALKEDEARQHFEAHELCMLPMHVAQRREKAERQGTTLRDLEEQMFQQWLKVKRAKGFDNFTCDWIDSDDELFEE